jgi:hypothetical protein
MRTQIVIGDVYGRWTVEAGSDLRGNERYYACVCQCGTRSMVRKSVLVADKSGCAACAPRLHNVTHGKTRSFEFGVWTAMKKRCQYPKHPHYALYGGRGISVAPAWRSFEAFFADMGACPHGKDGSIDRIDSDGNYEASNCRWVLKAAQAKHRRNVPLIDGMTLPELALTIGVKYSTLRARIKAGWPKELWSKTPQELGTRNHHG